MIFSDVILTFSSTFIPLSRITLGVVFARKHENIISDGSFENDDVSTVIDWSLQVFTGAGCVFGLTLNEQLKLFNEAVEYNRIQFVLRYFSRDNTATPGDLCKQKVKDQKYLVTSKHTSQLLIGDLHL